MSKEPSNLTSDLDKRLDREYRNGYLAAWGAWSARMSGPVYTMGGNRFCMTPEAISALEDEKAVIERRPYAE